jgi:SAM-dependent methyltransferase
MYRNRLEGEFYDYMHHLGQIDAGWNREVLAFYVPWFIRCRQVLDVGCGDGQFIELLQAEGVKATGIDFDARMVQACQEKGLDVVQADLFDYLTQQEAQFDGIFSSNLIEHLSGGDALRFIRVACQALAPAGLLVVTTPNPESLIVHLYEFWRDATHVRPYNRPLLEFLFHTAGLEEIASGENPRTTWTLSPAMEQVSRSLDETSSLPETNQGDLAWPRMPQPTIDLSAPLLRRLRFSLRRRLARFLAQTVLFEEFSSLNDAVRQLSYAQSDVQSTLFLKPREIFVRGVRPRLDPERAQFGPGLE